MSGNLRVIVVVIVIALLGLGGWWVLNNRQTSGPAVSTPTSQVDNSAQPTPASTNASDSANSGRETVVNITELGFAPKTVTVKTGGTITWVNTDKVNHTVNSDVHPTHLLYPFLNLGAIAPGDKKSLVVTKTGTFTYHDHLNPSLTGTIIAQ